MNALDLFSNEERLESFQAGDTIFREGDEGKSMYVVVEGAVRLSVTGRSLDRVGKGGVFGEMALIDAAPRSATAIAASECKLASVSRERFMELVGQSPPFALEIMTVMANRLRSMDRRL